MTSLDRDEILRRMRGWALRRAATLLPESDVDDAAQEAMMAVWSALDRLRPGADPWPLLVVAARGAIVRYARRFYARRATPVPAGVEMGSRYDTTEAAALDRLGHPTIRAALNGLPPLERKAVVLVDMCDVRPGDASRLLGLSPDAGALRRARRSAHARLRGSLSHLQEVAA